MAEVALRWKLAAEEGASGQAALFPDETAAQRHVGTGEFRGMEFLHVNAKSVINQVPSASRMPFRYTINAYRGCSHACLYCGSPETPVLMADGRHRPLADVTVGDEVYGTEMVRGRRRLTTTLVQAHWTTKKPGIELTLPRGRTLVTSAEHRLLTPLGWKRVEGLQPGDSVVDKFGDPEPIANIDPWLSDVPMCDITTGTGDYIANGVVSHNCFARPTHDYLGLNIGTDFDSKIVVKINAVERVRAELKAKRWAGDGIAMGTNTDPYQRCEGKYHLTRGIVEALGEAKNPFSILTKSTLILRDLDVLKAAARVTDVRCSFSIGTLDEAVWKASEPGTPHPMRRVEAVAKLNAAGIPCGVLMAPVLPGLSDRPEQIRAVVDACVAAGATSITPLLLHLRGPLHDHYLSWLRGYRPDLLEMYEARYAKAYLPKADQQAFSSMVHDMIGEARRLRRGARAG
jgi:DNA repair photolyase